MQSSKHPKRAVAQAHQYEPVRMATLALVAPLSEEDCAIQSMPDASPVKWHLAHTTWFFETFVLEPYAAGYRPFDPAYRYLFNSYYNALGERHPRPERGMLSRPSLAEVLAYRRHVDEAMLARNDLPAELVQLGLHHEQQHQELILTDLKHLLSRNPLHPTYRGGALDPASAAPPLTWIDLPSGIREIGHAGSDFCFDNELPRHRVFVDGFRLASRLVTNAEYLAFMRDGGYERPQLWLSDGWDTRSAQGWSAPLYWEREDGRWRVFTLRGMRDVDPNEPVCHVSYYEADAYARWARVRLPTEAEWEVAAVGATARGTFVESGRLHPAPAHAGAGLQQMFGDLWQWTGSAYLAYPGYRPAAGAVGEYNGKFMVNQFVLRGGSCATPQSHIRASYRNFFPPAARWQFSGIRLAA